MSTFDLGPVRALRPDERDDAPVVGLGEFFNATWEEGRKASNFDAHLKNYSDAFDGIADRVKAATGEALDNPFRSATLGQSAELLTTFSREAVDASSPVTAWRQRVRELQAKHADKLDWDSLIDEPGKVAFASMKKAREDADALAERAGMIAPRDVPVLGGVPVVNSIAALGVNAVRHPGYTAAQLAAAIGSQMTSPADAAVNLISFGVGGTAKSIIKNATMNALSNAAGQALLSGPKQLAYQSAGLPYGWGVWAEEVGAAAGAGFAIDAGIRTPIRAAVNRFGRDAEAGTLFSRNTARGGFFLDAVTDATPTPRVRPTLDIDPETIKKAEAGDLAASKEILEKTGALNDPAVRYAVEHIEGGGKLTDEALRVLESMGVARPDGMRLLADALTGRMPEAMPEPVRAADAPLMPERGAPLLGRLAEVQDQVARLPARVQEAVADGLEAGLPAVVRAVEDAFAGPRETFPERVAQALDARTIAAVRLHGGRAGAVEAARYIRQFPDLIDDTVPLEAGRIEQARAIARLDDGAFAAVAEGAVPPEVAALISSRVPKAQQSRVIGDIEKARPRSMAEAADMIEMLTMPERVAGELAPGARIDDPSGPEAKAHLEALRGEAGPAYEAAMAPIRRRDELESEIETKRGQIAKLEQEAQKAPDSPETKEGASPDEQIAAARAELRDLEAELAQVQGEIDPSPGGQQLYRVAMRALALRREADVIRAINDAMDMGRRMAPEGTRIDVVNEIDAGGGRVADAVAMPDGSIQLAIAAVDPMAKISHEAVHVLVTKGHLSPDEVSALAALAREAGTFKDEAAYRETYADRQSLDRLIEEEAAASYIEARIKGTVKGPPNTVVERIRQLMERIKQLLAGYGFQSREDVVQAIMSGDAARRDARAEWMRDAQTQGRKAMADAAERGVDLPDGTRVNGVPLFAIRAFHGSDQGSRAAGDGSRNYVVFDDSLIEIVAKDGQPVLGQDITAATVKDGKLYAFAGERARTADRMNDLARYVGATRIEDIGPNDPHPGRVLAFHGTAAPAFETFDLDQMRSFGIHFGPPDLADLYTDNSRSTSRIIPAVLDLRNVVTLPDMDRWNATSIAKAVEAAMPFAEGLGAEASRISRDAGNQAATEFLRQRLADVGIQGLRYWNAGADPGWAYIVWNPGHVISATSGDRLFSLRSDLDMSPEARKARAEAMGFDTSKILYHGTQAAPFDAFDLDRIAQSGEPDVAVYLTPSSDMASSYAGATAEGKPNFYKYLRTALQTGSSISGKNKGRVLPVYARMNNPKTIRMRDPGYRDTNANEIFKAKREGHDGLIMKFNDSPDEYVVFDPANIRSVNAEFDPSKSDSPNLMYAIRSDEPSLKQDMATVDRMNRIGELIQACRA